MDSVPLSMRLAALPGMQAMTAKMPVNRTMVKALLRQIGLERAIETGTFTDEMIDWFVSLQRDTDTMANDLRSSPECRQERCGPTARRPARDDCAHPCSLDCADTIHPSAGWPGEQQAAALRHQSACGGSRTNEPVVSAAELVPACGSLG